MSYFLLAVSNRVNLDLCVRHGLAGFTDSINGLWTYLDIQEGDYVSFLYGARAYNLYKVAGKAAYKDADRLPPWPPVKFRPSGKQYHFPFRLDLQHVRSLDEPLVRAEFAYVAENLLLRGGYRKTHFQADQTTLQNLSEMGFPSPGSAEPLDMARAETFTPQLVRDRDRARPPYVFPVRELIVQTMLRSHLSDTKNLHDFLTMAGIHGLDASKLEVLGEKAFPEGHVDILIKEATPIALGRKVVVEVKLGRAASGDIEQLKLYMERLGEECAGGVLVAREIGTRIQQRIAGQRIACATYCLARLGDEPGAYDTLFNSFSLSWRSS